MKKLILLLILTVLSCSSYAEQTVGKYKNKYFGKEYEIEAAAKNDKLSSVFIGIDAQHASEAFISVDGKDLELFKTALELVKYKYSEWVKVAKDNNVTELTKEFDIDFPSVSVAWLGSKWWFSFGHKVKLVFIILDDGKMVAAWAPKVTASSNKYIDEQVFFAFGCEEDFDSLISQLDYQSILNQLLTKKNNEDLFK